MRQSLKKLHTVFSFRGNSFQELNAQINSENLDVASGKLARSILNSFRTSSPQIAEKNNQGQRDRDRGRQQTVLTEVMNDKRLQIEQPEGRQKHQRYENLQRGNRDSISEGCEYRQAENYEVGNRSYGRKRERSDLRICTTQ